MFHSSFGSTGNPFSGSATTVIVGGPGTGNMSYDTTYDFSLAITRVSETEVSVAGSLAEAGGGLQVNVWPETTTLPSPDDFTYNCVGILLGGTTDATEATLTNVEVTGGQPEGEDLVITALSGRPGIDDLTLTWVSNPGSIYAVDSSSDLASWPTEIDDNIPAATEGNLTSFVIPPASIADGERLFFRVREVGP